MFQNPLPRRLRDLREPPRLLRDDHVRDMRHVAGASIASALRSETCGDAGAS